MSWGLLTFDAGVSDPHVLLEVVNHSAHQVRVTSVGFYPQDGSRATMPIVHQPPGSTVPGVIPPNDSGQSWIEVEALESTGVVDLRRPLVGWALDAEAVGHSAVLHCTKYRRKSGQMDGHSTQN